MKTTPRQREFIELAKRKGFSILSIDRASGHLKLRVKGPSSVEFSASLSSTPSASLGPKNWIQDLRRQERTALQRQEKPMQKLHHSQIMLPDDHQVAATALHAMEERDLILVKYTIKKKTWWYLNAEGSTSRGKIAGKIGGYLVRENLVTETEKAGNKTLFRLNKQKVQVKPPPPEIVMVNGDEPEPEEKELHKEVAHAVKKLSAREQLIQEALEPLSDEEVKQALFFGVEMLKDDLQKELQQRQARLDKVQEALKCLG